MTHAPPPPAPPRPLSFRVVVITDRTLVPAADIPARLAAILAACPRGSVAVQVREKDLDGGPLLALSRAVIEVARPAGALVFINDRLDVALAAGADGVHLPEAGLSVDAARGLAAGRLVIGCSRHSEAAVTDAATGGADLVQLGPIFATPRKGAPLGASALAAPHGSAYLVAVGGIDSPGRAADAVRAGANAVALIRAAWQPQGPTLLAELVRSLT